MKVYYKPVGTWRINSLNNKIQPVSLDQKHIQILYSTDRHWRLVQFPDVQQQLNSRDCGIFAIAFAISLLFDIDPHKVRYDHSVMRSHLLKIFKSKVIEHFPQDLKYGPPHKVLPLASIRVREAEATLLETNNNNIALSDDIDNQVFINDTNKIMLFDDSGHQISSNNKYNIIENSKMCDNLKSHAFHEKNRYNQNLQHNRAGKKRRYKEDVENVLERNRSRYRANNENVLEGKRIRYRKNNENILKVKRRQYAENSEDICTRKRRRYEANSEDVRPKKRGQYKANSSKRYIQERKRYAKAMENKKTKQKILEGKWRKSTYNKATLLEPLMMNMKGQVVNVLPLTEAQAKKSWSCDTSCKTKNDSVLIERYQKFLEFMSNCSLKYLPKIRKNHECSHKTSHMKMGHTLSCYIDHTLCKAF
ncbi:hypothetical protein PV328_011985 [Microctonus aethiopoides]|uniref:Ubiquitin-like protease family profile domain-containing protein n=1 Tax=Microctonus aethiopoides TaxID=144406 RepID=A0AA39EUC9_9HYME|nr:hypothetical protein PV328_011985 [Microctonus aethiopoides]